jgi:hypothetical protein
MISIDFVLARGPTVLRGEVIGDAWEVPNVADRLRELAYHAEVQRDLIAGLSAAVRAGYLDFRAVDPGTGTPADWDEDVLRLEASAGYRFVRNGGVTLSGYWQDAGTGGETTLSALRLWWAF